MQTTQTKLKQTRKTQAPQKGFLGEQIAKEIFEKRSNGELAKDFNILVKLLEKAMFKDAVVVLSAYLRKYGYWINPEKVELIFLEDCRGTPVIRIKLEGGAEMSITEYDIFVGD